MKKLQILLLGVVVPVMAAGLAVATFGWWALQPAASTPAEAVRVTVAPGTPVSRIAQQLKEAGVIRSPFAFKFIVWKNKLAGSIQAGSFELSPNDTPEELAQHMTQGTEDVWITIREGLRATEIGELLEQKLDQFDASSPDFTEICLENEGFLFPETYLVPREFTPKSMCTFLRAQFDQVMTDTWQTEIQRQGWTQRRIVTLASIIEREARNPQDMKVVSGILRNRLDMGKALQVDATLQYAKGYNEAQQTWWSPPTSADKEVNSPYNTYKNTGLPPGPISNPGKNALEAAIFPTESEYLYYISNSDGSEMHYARTYEEHQQNIARYLR